MNIGRLKENMSFKNYKTLCDFLGIKTASGNSKQAQLTELARHCRIERVGHYIYIREVYASPTKEKTKRGRKGLYSKILQNLIMDFLVGQNIKEFCATRNRVLFEIKVMNESFVYSERGVSVLQEKMNIPREILFDFFNTTNKVFKGAFEVAMKNLMQQKLIHCDIVLMVAYQADSDSNSKLLHREIMPHELNAIQKIEEQVLHQFGYTSMKEVNFSKARAKKFTKQVMRLYNEQQTEQKEIMQFRYNAHRIVLSEELEEEYLLTFIIQDDNKKELLRSQLNQLLCEQLRKNAVNRHQQALNSDKTDFIMQARRSEQYVTDHERLIKRLIVQTVVPTEAVKTK